VRKKRKTFYDVPVLSHLRASDRQTDRQTNIVKNDAIPLVKSFDNLCRLRISVFSVRYL